MLVNLEMVSKFHNEKVILNQVSLALEEKSKTALIGINGTGKSTLLKMIAGVESYDQGKIIRKKDSKVAYLPQEPILDDTKTILEQVLTNAQKDISEFEVKAILGKLGLYQTDAKIAVLSGGQRKRVALAEVLLKECDLLLLDEPTNHLDADMIEWLEGYLIKWNRALFMVTHDRYFMERITNQIVEMDHGKLYAYEGNYATYIEMKERRMAVALNQERKRQNILRKELAWVRAGVQARGTKSKERLERFAKLNEMVKPTQDGNIKVSTLASRLGKKTIEIVDIAKQYDNHVLFQDFSYQLKRHERIGILGANGCGKSTLLQVLHHDIDADSGSVIYGETVKIGFFRQGSEAMDPQKRVIDIISDISDDMETKEGHFSAAQMLEQFLFDRHMQYQKVATLSGGEKRRLYLLSVLMATPNILFLDEPTNDLDIQTLQILEDYLDDFPGIVIVVSHDRYFLDRICDAMWIFTDQGRIQTTIGGYSQYMELKRNDDHQKKPVQADKKKQSHRNSLLSLTSKEKQELATINDEIASLEEQMKQNEEAMTQYAQDFSKLQALGKQRTLLEQALEEKTLRWMELEEKRTQIEAQKRK